MSITHKLEERVETINEKISIAFTPEWEEETTIEQVSLRINNGETEENINLGGYFIDSVAGERSWVEYNSKCVVFFNGNRYTGTSFITKIYDIENKEFISGTLEELTKYYMQAFEIGTKVKKLENSQSSVK